MTQPSMLFGVVLGVIAFWVVPPFAEAIDCYSCDYSSHPEWRQPSTCSLPFDASNATTCSAKNSTTSAGQCFIQWENYTSASDEIVFIQRRCELEPSLKAEECANYTKSSPWPGYVFFMSGILCCYRVEEPFPNFGSMACFCDCDLCNGDVYYPANVPKDDQLTTVAL